LRSQYAIPAQSRLITEETKKRENKKLEQEIELRIDALRSVELFNTMNETELREMATHLRYAPFNRGEVLTRQGTEAHWLYIIKTGEVVVRIGAEGLPETEVARLHAGDFFGEMSLMTGEPRSATIVALEDVECYRLDKEAFQGILAARPEIAEDISRILANRRIQLEVAYEGIDAESRNSRVDATQSHILGLIRGFFRL
jgi:CRP-like cAMP-binding protein